MMLESVTRYTEDDLPMEITAFVSEAQDCRFGRRTPLDDQGPLLVRIELEGPDGETWELSPGQLLAVTGIEWSQEI